MIRIYVFPKMIHSTTIFGAGLIYIFLGHSFHVLSYFSVKQTSVTDKVLCYYTTWAESYFGPDDIDVDICTHVLYSPFRLNENGSLRVTGNPGMLKKLTALKSKNPNLKILISVGGMAVFSRVAADAQKTENMVTSVLWYLNTYNFDGIDVDWEYPGKHGGTPADRQNFISLLKALRIKLDTKGFLLTAAVCLDPKCGDYNVAAISNIVNYINVMTYDMHSYLQGKTGENSPLYASSTDSPWAKTHLSCDAAITNWLKSGAAPEKTILGLAFYGRGFTLKDPNNHGIGAPTVGNGTENKYGSICTLTNGWTEVWNDEQKVPYKYYNKKWIGYDNPQSIGLKVQYAKTRNLGGVMMWSVDQDDKTGACGTKHALLQAIKNNL